MKVCTVFKDILAKIPKTVHSKEEKGQFRPSFGPILTILGKSGATVIVKIFKLKVPLLDQGIY